MKTRARKNLLMMGMLIILHSGLYGQLRSGDYVSSVDLNKSLSYCANGMGETSISDLLQPPTKALLLNFFASY